MNDSKGFTMLEVILTVIILGILTSLAVPSINSIIGMQNMKTAGRTLVSELRSAQQNAVSSNTHVTVLLNPDPLNTYSAGAGSIKHLPEGVRIISTDFTNNAFRFSPTGSLVETGGEIPVQGSVVMGNSEGKRIYVRISTSGRVLLDTAP